MTFVITWVNTGMTDGFALRWFRAFYIAWPIAFILIMLGAPRLQKLVAKHIKPIAWLAADDACNLIINMRRCHL